MESSAQDNRQARRRTLTFVAGRPILRRMAEPPADLLPRYLAAVIDQAMAAQAAAEDQDIPGARAAIEAMTLPLVEAGKLIRKIENAKFRSLCQRRIAGDG